MTTGNCWSSKISTFWLKAPKLKFSKGSTKILTERLATQITWIHISWWTRRLFEEAEHHSTILSTRPSTPCLLGWSFLIWSLLLSIYGTTLVNFCLGFYLYLSTVFYKWQVPLKWFIVHHLCLPPFLCVRVCKQQLVLVAGPCLGGSPLRGWEIDLSISLAGKDLALWNQWKKLISVAIIYN